jgi:hypothetical protein
MGGNVNSVLRRLLARGSWLLVFGFPTFLQGMCFVDWLVNKSKPMTDEGDCATYLFTF